MTTTYVLFIQGGGRGAHSEDAALADSLKRTLGPEYIVRFPEMPGEAAIARSLSILGHPLVVEAFVRKNIDRRNPQFVALAEDRVIGWCDMGLLFEAMA